jgi:thiamine-phosphate pyrophosphorylase
MRVLYVTDRPAVGDERFFAILAALAGAPVDVELREKGTDDRRTLQLAQEAKARLGHGVSLTVNGRFDVALAAGAAGVHLPADGLPLSRVRSSTPRGFRVGVSTHAPEEARAAIDAGADTVVIGPIFDTPSKRSYGPPLGPEALARLPEARSHGCAVYAIGGIDEGRLAALEPFRDRFSGVAAIRLIQESADPRGVIERLAAR